LCEGDIIQQADLPPSLLSAVKPSSNLSEEELAAVLPVLPDSALFPQYHNTHSCAAGTNESQKTVVDSLLPLKTFLREQEQAYLNRALEQCGGDKEQAAILLGVSLATLYRKLSGED